MRHLFARRALVALPLFFGCESAGGLLDADATRLSRDANDTVGDSGPTGGIALDIPDAGAGPNGGSPGPAGGAFVKPDGDAPESDAVARPTDAGARPTDAASPPGDATRPPEVDAGPMGCVPSPELCNGIDDDCDGEIDEMFLGTGEVCDTALPGLCARGVRRCEQGALTCEGVGPAGEICDNQDNDCDGQTDEEDGFGGQCHCRGNQPLVVLQQICDDGGGGSSHVAACGDEAELHIFSAYESAGRNGFIDVTITRTGAPLVLVFSSYEPATWRVTLGEGVVVRSAVLNGYNPQMVQGLPADFPVTDRSGIDDYLSACGYFWPMDDGGCDTPALVMGAEALTRTALTTFQGCYGAQSFLLGNQ